MGGLPKCVKPKKYKELEKNKEILDFFVKEGLHLYILEMKGHNTIPSTKFSNSWNKGLLDIGRIKLVVTLELIREAMRLEFVDLKVEMKGTLDYNKFRHNLFEGTEEDICVSSINGCEILSLLIPFGAILN